MAKLGMMGAESGPDGRENEGYLFLEGMTERGAYLKRDY